MDRRSIDGFGYDQIKVPSNAREKEQAKEKRTLHENITLYIISYTQYYVIKEPTTNLENGVGVIELIFAIELDFRRARLGQSHGALTLGKGKPLGLGGVFRQIVLLDCGEGGSLQLAQLFRHYIYIYILCI